MSRVESWMLSYLLNSLWQMPLIFAAAWIAAKMARRSGPGLTHRVWVSALLLEVAVPACGFGFGDLGRELWRRAGIAGGEVRVTVGAGTVSSAGGLHLSQAAMAAAALGYGCSVLYFAGRLGWGLWRTRRIELQAKPVRLTGERLRQWKRCGLLFDCAGARVAMSPEIAGPVTVGIRRGAVLVPPGFLAGVAGEDWSAVVAHEFAHMRRRDFAKNLVYGALSLPAAYHPVLWLTRSRLAESREMICDRMAAEAVTGTESYARSLLRLAALLTKSTPARTLHAIGIFDANTFERRVMNLTQGRVEMRGARRLGMAAACAMVGLVACATALALRMDVTAASLRGPAASAVTQSASSARMTVPAAQMQAVYKKNPVYPPKARATNDTLDGPVVLAVTVGDDGMPTEVHVTRSLRPDYDESALEAVRDWRWHPYLVNGEPVAVDTTVTVNYSLAK